MLLFHSQVIVQEAKVENKGILKFKIFVNEL